MSQRKWKKLYMVEETSSKIQIISQPKKKIAIKSLIPLNYNSRNTNLTKNQEISLNFLINKSK